MRHTCLGLNRCRGGSCQKVSGAGFSIWHGCVGVEKLPNGPIGFEWTGHLRWIGSGSAQTSAKIGGWGEKGSHLVEIVLIELADKRGKVGVLEEAGKYDFCELGHVLYDETVTLSTPADDGGEFWLGEHAGKV